MPLLFFRHCLVGILALHYWHDLHLQCYKPRIMVLNNWWKLSLLNFITSVLPVFCVDLFNFLYLEKLKSTCKHVLHYSLFSFHPAMWYCHFLFPQQEYSSIEKHRKEINDNFSMIFFEKTKNSPNSYQLRIERKQLFADVLQNRCSWCPRPEGLKIF